MKHSPVPAQQTIHAVLSAEQRRDVPDVREDIRRRHERKPALSRAGNPPRWDFHKYLIERTGHPVAVFESAVEPADTRVRTQVEKLRAQR